MATKDRPHLKGDQRWGASSSLTFTELKQVRHLEESPEREKKREMERERERERERARKERESGTAAIWLMGKQKQ